MPLNDILSGNKLTLFGSSSAKAQSKDKQELASLKSDVQLFSSLYIACQTREGNLDDYLSIVKTSLSLSQAMHLRTGTKSDRFQCFEEI